MPAKTRQLLYVVVTHTKITFTKREASIFRTYHKQFPQSDQDNSLFQHLLQAVCTRSSAQTGYYLGQTEGTVCGSSNNWMLQNGSSCLCRQVQSDRVLQVGSPAQAEVLLHGYLARSTFLAESASSEDPVPESAEK